MVGSFLDMEMTETIELRRLKLLARRYARANRVPQHQALDLVAIKLGFPSWTKTVTASKNSWRPDPDQLVSIKAFVEGALPTAVFRVGEPEAMTRQFSYLEEGEHGRIGNHAYRLHVVLDDVIIAGEGWSIRVPENPGAIPVVETYTDDTACPVHDPDFLREALNLARDKTSKVRAGISIDWPRRSTKPDLDGVVRHPLSGIESQVWFCLHCDGKITGVQIAENLWHCPGCGASPLDIFDTPFWSEDGGKSLLPVQTSEVGRDTADVRIVDGRPKLDLTEEKIVLLIRSALLDDASNVSEKLGALRAEIGADGEDVWITLDIDLWPEDKEPLQALAVAELLGLEVELISSSSDLPFAWPDLGQFASSTSEYTSMMLDAYAEHGSLPIKEERG